MSSNKYITKSKVAAGAALVALSSFVPQPLIDEANAATVTVNVTGKFITGITATATNDIKLGTIIASAKTGFVDMDAAAATAVSSATFVGTPAVGKVKLNGVVDQPVDFKVAGFGKLTLTGGGATNTATLTKVYFGNALDTAITATGGTGTATATATGGNLTADALTTTQTGTLQLGARIVWSNGAPVGTFSQALTITITY